MTVFADTAYFIALLNARDAAHAAALGFSRRTFNEIVLTEFILLELGDAFCNPADRADFLAMDAHTRTNPAHRIIPASPELLQRGRDLFAARPDKAWSLTDCISFVVMEDLAIADALTTDHHFSQAGFRALLIR